MLLLPRVGVAKLYGVCFGLLNYCLYYGRFLLNSCCFVTVFGLKMWVLLSSVLCRLGTNDGFEFVGIYGALDS